MSQQPGRRQSATSSTSSHDEAPAADEPRRSSLPSTLSLPGSQAVKTTSMVKSDPTPVCIRSGSALSSMISADVKRPSLSKFVPNVRPSTSSSTSTSAASTPVRLVKSEPATLDISSILAHSLSLKNMQQGGNKHLQDLHLKRAAGKGGGAFGSRGGNDKRAFSVQAKIQQHLSNIRKRKNGKKSMNMLELSWAEGPNGVPLYSPVTLPYVATTVDTEAEEPVEPGSGPKRRLASKRPTSRHIDESNRHAASLFDENTEDEFSDSSHQWIVVQLPIVLPALDHTMKDDSSSYCASNIESLPEGRLGVLKIYKSRRVTFNLGDHEFEVNQGSDCNFSQEVACLISNNSELMFLGRCNKRVVVTPVLSKIAA